MPHETAVIKVPLQSQSSEPMPSPLSPAADMLPHRLLAAMVESRMGAVAWAIRQRSVSHPRSSNRTCPIKASGSPTGFTERHTQSNPTARGYSTVSNSPSPLDTAISSGACHCRCLQAFANHRDLAIFESTPEVRALPPASIPRLRRSYAPVRLPPWPPPFRDVEAATPT